MCTALQYSSVKDLISVDSHSDYSNFKNVHNATL